MSTLIHDTYLDNKISEVLLKKNKVRAMTHERSGKLSASRLAWPLQWQILHAVGVPSKDIDAYTLRKFERGNQAEDWLIQQMNPLDSQKYVEYRDCVGYVDAVVDMTEWSFPHAEIIPHEIKSVTNRKFNWVINKQKLADKQHKLQACLYALAMSADYYAIDYVAADDLRVRTFIYKTSDEASEVNTYIDMYNEARSKKTVPVFEARLSWQDKEEYSTYPSWAGLSAQECMSRLEKEYPDSYQKLIDFNN